MALRSFTAEWSSGVTVRDASKWQAGVPVARCARDRAVLASAGADQGGDDRRPLSLLPTALIFVKDFEITGHWTEADKATLSEAFAVGPFAFHGSSANVDETLKQPGITPLATIDERLPRIPPRLSPGG